MSTILLDSNKERNKVDQQRQEAKSSKTIKKSIASINAKKLEASKQDNAFLN